MTQATKLPFFTFSAVDLADWLDRRPDVWWSVDGDPTLMSAVDFPCPSEELSAELRRVGKGLRIFDPREDSTSNGLTFDVNDLDALADRENNSRARTFLLAWEGGDIPWLLAEYIDAES